MVGENPGEPLQKLEFCFGSILKVRGEFRQLQ
jgi:hypothetical protein